MALLLCREVYHCTPSELDEQDLDTVLDHLLCLEVEAENRKLNQQLRNSRRAATFKR